MATALMAMSPTTPSRSQTSADRHAHRRTNGEFVARHTFRMAAEMAHCRQLSRAVGSAPAGAGDLLGPQLGQNRGSERPAQSPEHTERHDENWLDDRASASVPRWRSGALSRLPLLIIIVDRVERGQRVAYRRWGQLAAVRLGARIHFRRAGQRSTGRILATALSVAAAAACGASTAFAALGRRRRCNGAGATPCRVAGVRARASSRSASFSRSLSRRCIAHPYTALAALCRYVLRHFEGLVGFVASMDFLLSIVPGTALVALMVAICRRGVWRGVTSSSERRRLRCCFTWGGGGIGPHLGRATQPTAYGAAASFAALLL